MSAEENKATARRFVDEVPVKGNMDYMDEVVTADFVFHGTDISGREAFKQDIAAVRSALPDLMVVIEDQIAEGNRVATRYTVSGTMEGDLFGFPPTGEHGSWTGIMFWGFTPGGKVSEWWVSEDMLQKLLQFGLIDSPWPGED